MICKDFIVDRRIGLEEVDACAQHLQKSGLDKPAFSGMSASQTNLTLE